MRYGSSALNTLPYLPASHVDSSLTNINMEDISRDDSYLQVVLFVSRRPFNTPYLDIPEGRVLVGLQNLRIYIFSDRLLAILHAMYLVSNKVALN